MGETRIGRGTKIDNLVQIAHGVTVGRNTLLASQVGIAGSTTIGDNVILAGQVGVAGTHHDRRRREGHRDRPASTNSVAAGRFVSGLPAVDNRRVGQAGRALRRLPEYRRQLLDLERRLSALEAGARARAAGALIIPRAIIDDLQPMITATSPVVSSTRRRALGVALAASRWPWPSPGRPSARRSHRPNSNTSASRCPTGSR